MKKLNTDEQEAVWRRAEYNMLRRERMDRIRRGVIIPFTRGVPNVMARDKDGRWWPNKNFVGVN